MKLNKIAAVISCSILGLTISSCSADKDNATTATTTPQVKQIVEAKGTATQAPVDKKQDTTEDTTKLKMSGDASYVVGYQVGSGIASQNFDLNNDQIVVGFKDALQGADSKIPQEDIERNMLSLKDQMMKKQIQAIEDNKSKSNDFMDEVAKIKGIVKVDDGVYYQMIKQGDGKKPNADSEVTISYKGTTPVATYNKNKASFDDIKAGKLIGPSFDSSESATFPLTNLIECWKDAIPEIPNGSTIILYCSPDTAYGTRAPASIGPNQALSFEITLKDFK